MNRDEKNSQLRSIIEKLCKEQIFSDVDVIIENLSEIYQEGFKHNYSELTTIILNATKNDPEQDLMILAQNLRGFEKKLDSYSQDVKLRIAKFYDHVNLECVRLQDSSEKISRLQNTYKELDKNYKELDKNYKELSENLNKQQTQYITILGIFASIVLTFVSGLVFSNSILSNIDKASIYRLVFVMAFIALFVGNILYFLFAFLIKISLNIHFKINWLLIVFNFIISMIMLIDFVCYLFNIKTIESMIIDF
ncbi:TPA: hypothetical protein RTH03_001443 [Campylobacter jejuni]|nr:hypothetical protein [Campylobacter jejuni]HDZ5091073.1 hypothetical protein [Campylobacter jejuni]HDZ5092706.1 hypothetical protein [Campylobacter jejuni]HDZ5101112.1 hypothetical protein [Campylobacter jejuni]HDZ5105918.1 hypothetical protein [Campylobacter jejuni]